MITSGATESNNLALLGYATHPRQTRRQIISCQTEHRAVLDPLKRLEHMGFEVIYLPVKGATADDAGRIDVDHLAEVISDRTALVTVMLANNEIGVIQPLREIAELCHAHDCLLHTDATQAVGACRSMSKA